MTNEQHVAWCGRLLDVHRTEPGSLYTVEGCVTLCKTCHGPQPRRPKGAVDRAKPGGKFVELPTGLVEQVNAMCEQNGMTFTFEVIDALRRHLAYPPRREPEPMPDAEPKGKKK